MPSARLDFGMGPEESDTPERMERPAAVRSLAELRIGIPNLHTVLFWFKPHTCEAVCSKWRVPTAPNREGGIGCTIG